MAVYQSYMDRLTHRHRGQAPSHIFACIPHQESSIVWRQKIS
jgi:hypothetical protein